MSAVGPGRLALWWLVGLGCVLALAVVALGRPRIGGNILAGTLALGGAIRLVLPASAAGGLVVRPRVLDVLIYLSLAAVVAIGANAVNWSPPR